MKKGFSKNTAGIGGKREEIPFGGFVSITGGGEIQRRHARMYGKKDHLEHDRMLDGIVDADDLQGPLLDISLPKRIF